MTNKESTTQFCDSYHSTKCIGVGNNRKHSTVTARARRQVNKKRRLHLLRDLQLRIEDHESVC